MRREITWTVAYHKTYTAVAEVPDEWLGEGEADHLYDIVGPLEHNGHVEAISPVVRTFVESHPLDA